VGGGRWEARGRWEAGGGRWKAGTRARVRGKMEDYVGRDISKKSNYLLRSHGIQIKVSLRSGNSCVRKICICYVRG
jgi:hypothetical protein